MILPPSTLTPSGRPQLSAGEVDLEFEGHGGMQSCQTAERYQGGYAVVTSQRLIWIDSAASPAAGRSCHLALDCIHSTRKHVQYGLNLMNPKVRLEVKVYVDLSAKPTNRPAGAGSSTGAGPHSMQLQQQQAPIQAVDAELLATLTDMVSSDTAVDGYGVRWFLQGNPLYVLQLAVSSGVLTDAAGFPRPRVLRALVATQSEHLQAALDWILAAGDEPGAAKTSQTSASLAAAFQDLDKLMDMAAEMVKLAEKFRGVMGPDGAITLNHPAPSGAGVGGTSGSSSSSSPAGDMELLLDADTQLQLIAMGITSPVTKASAGSRYQQELSRQLADFLAVPLSRAGGVLLLPDVYCLFNRARGTELVSPDDLVQACLAFQEVGLPLRLRKFPSGVIVVQGSQFSDTQLCKNIAQLLQTTPADQGALYNAAVVPLLGPSLTASTVSAVLSLPLTLAREALLVAEAAGVLCRDDGPEGLRFFRNFYKDTQPVAF
eukprot:gene5632-5871_t